MTMSLGDLNNDGSLYTNVHNDLMADQHQRYLAAILTEHKIKDVKSSTQNEAVMMDIDDDCDGAEKGKGSSTDQDNKDNDDDADDDSTIYSTDNRGSTIGHIVPNIGSVNRKEPLTHEDSLNMKRDSAPRYKKNWKPKSNGLSQSQQAHRLNGGTHKYLVYSSSSDTAPSIDIVADKKVYPQKPRENRFNTLASSKEDRAERETSPNSRIKSLVETSGGVRVFPVGVPARQRDCNGDINHRRATEPDLRNHSNGLDQDSPPPIRRLRPTRPLPDFSGVSDLESFADITDL